MALDLEQLKTEILNDPKNLGYAALRLHGSHAGIANAINLVGKSGEQIDPQFLDPWRAQEAVDPIEFAALTQPMRDLWRILLQFEQMPMKSIAVRTQIAAIWAAGTQTRNRIVTLQKRSASRAEVLFGEGTFVTHEQIAEALAQ
jgi:hypothetical protein